MNVATIVFYSLLGVYFLGLGIFALVKRFKNKKRVKAELEELKNDETK